MSTAPYYQDDHVTLHHGDCLDVLAALPDESVHSVVTDPPYGLEFMGRKWDGWDSPAAFQQWCEVWARECLRVLKPGGHMLAFGGSRTWHRLACAVEDAGFEIRDSIAWLYGSGFPKSLDVSKAIDKAAGAERELKTVRSAASAYSANAGNHRPWMDNDGTMAVAGDTPVTPAAEAWHGWGTALKPAFEPIVVGRKPLSGTVAATVLEHGTGALNVDGCRVEAGQEYRDKCASVVGLESNRNGDTHGAWTGVREDSASPAGRWPANVLLDDTQAAELDEQSGESTSKSGGVTGRTGEGLAFGMGSAARTGHDDSGGASRFFPTFHYEAKAPTSERPKVNGIAHPTVKPLALMQWLVRLVTPPGGTVLEPFAGSGATLEACVTEGFACIGIEREADYLPLIVSRLDKPIQIALDFEAS